LYDVFSEKIIPCFGEETEPGFRFCSKRMDSKLKSLWQTTSPTC